MTPATPAGYSGTPLARKLGIVERTVLLPKGAPDDYRGMLAPLPDGVVFAARLSPKVDVIHLFTRERAHLERELRALREAIREDAAIWVSWPKRTARVPTDVTEDVIRAVALPIGLVDVKVCAVDATWSGLKLVIRRTERGTGRSTVKAATRTAATRTAATRTAATRTAATRR